VNSLINIIVQKKLTSYQKNTSFLRLVLGLNASTSSQSSFHTEINIQDETELQQQQQQQNNDTVVEIHP